MNIDTFQEWLRRQGHQVVSSPSGCWYDAGPHVFQAFPYHQIIEPSQHELRSLMLRHGILALRYSTPLQAPEGLASYHVILKPPYSYDILPHQARNGVKRGLKNFQIEQISFERLAEEGWKLQCDTLDRQCRSDSMCAEDWKCICRAAKDLPGFEAWAAIANNGELAAALYTNRVDDTWCIPYALSHRDYLRDHVNNALFYTVCCELLSRPGITGMFLSLHSLDAPESVNEFKFRMNFTAIPVRQRVVFHPAIDPIATRSTHDFLTRMMQRYPKHNFLSKAEGMLRFHVLGKLPLADQEWPECVSQYKPSPMKEEAPRPQREGRQVQSAEF